MLASSGFEHPVQDATTRRFTAKMLRPAFSPDEHSLGSLGRLWYFSGFITIVSSLCLTVEDSARLERGQRALVVGGLPSGLSEEDWLRKAKKGISLTRRLKFAFGKLTGFVQGCLPASWFSGMGHDTKRPLPDLDQHRHETENP